MKAIYNLGAIMRRAWAIRKSEAEKAGCKVMEINMSQCMKKAWTEAKDSAYAVVREWKAVSPEKQVEWLKKCIVRAAKDVIGYSTASHYHQFNERAAWGLHGHNFDEFVSQAWIALQDAFKRLPVVNERRAAKGLPPRSLVSLVYNAAKAAIMKIWESDKKHGQAIQDPEVVNDNGNIESWTETRVAAAGYNTEASAIIRADLERFTAGRDETDRKIIYALAEGYTERQIGKSVGISGVAVHKRIVKIRAALLDAGAA